MIFDSNSLRQEKILKSRDEMLEIEFNSNTLRSCFFKYYDNNRTLRWTTWAARSHSPELNSNLTQFLGGGLNDTLHDDDCSSVSIISADVINTFWTVNWNPSVADKKQNGQSWRSCWEHGQDKCLEGVGENSGATDNHWKLGLLFFLRHENLWSTLSNYLKMMCGNNLWLIII